VKPTASRASCKTAYVMAAIYLPVSQIIRNSAFSTTDLPSRSRQRAYNEAIQARLQNLRRRRRTSGSLAD